MKAFNQMLEYCSNLECSSNEFNFRTVLPTRWRPADSGYDSDKLRRDANYLSIEFANLIEYGKPRFLTKDCFDYDNFLKVSWSLRIPFDIYSWESARYEYPDGFDGEGNPRGRGKYIPPQMREWCFPQFLYLSELSKQVWSLPEFNEKQTEVLTFMDDNPNLKEEYRQKIGEVVQHYNEWLDKLNQASNLMNSLQKSA